jgi:transposase
MAMGRRKAARQEALFVTAEQLPRSQGHPFYRALNALLPEADLRPLDRRPLSAVLRADRDSRATFDSAGCLFQHAAGRVFRGNRQSAGDRLAVRCSLSLREFLGLPLNESSPDHSTLSLTRRRLPSEIFTEVFQFVLKIAAQKKLLSGKTVGVDSTTLEADAAMKSIIRRDTGWSSR